MSEPHPAPLLQTPLHGLHVELGARMVPFAGYDMPVQYPPGIIAEHQHTRAEAGLFDVSHMGQALLSGRHVAAALERLVPADLKELEEGRSRYTQLLDLEGNILDDLIVTRLPADGGGERFFLVVNAGTKAQDFAHIESNLPGLTLEPLAARALIALQGPKAADVLRQHFPQCAAMPFMSMQAFTKEGVACFVSRSGYTGEDGFEISVPAEQAEAFTRALLADPRVKPVGLGARDSLRLEAGLCLYGHDIDRTTNPVEAGLTWSIGRRRREEGGFPGADRIRLLIAHQPPRRRVGLSPVVHADGHRLPAMPVAREGADILSDKGEIVGRVTSGGFSPTLGHPIAMAYVARDHAAIGTTVEALVRGRKVVMRIVPMPFAPHHYFKS